MPMATKLGRVVTYHEELPNILSRITGSIMTLLGDIRCQRLLNHGVNTFVNTFFNLIRNDIATGKTSF